MSEKVSHTPEPWRFEDGADNEFITGESPILGSIMADDSDGITSSHIARIWSDGPNPESDARRIVACVNACKGIELQTLEAAVAQGGIGALEVLADNLELRQQRDQLAEALKYWMPDESNVLAEGSVPGAGSVRAKFYEHIALLSSLKEQ